MTLFLVALLVAAAITVFILISDKPSDRSHLGAAGLNGNNVDAMLFNLQNDTRRIQAVIQAEIVGDMLTMDSIKRNDYHGPLPERRDDGGWLSIYDNLRILKIAGINHRQGISRYVGRVECALVPEPDNEYDPDAIKIVAEDRHHLGYIPSGQTSLVCSLSANEFPYRCTAFIEAHEDEIDGHKFFTGYVYIKRLD